MARWRTAGLAGGAPRLYAMLLCGTAMLNVGDAVGGEHAHAAGPDAELWRADVPGAGFTSPIALTPSSAVGSTGARGMALFFLSTGSMAGIAIDDAALGLPQQHLELAGHLAGFRGPSAITVPPLCW